MISNENETMEREDQVMSNVSVTTIAFGVLMLVLSAIGFALLNSLQMTLNSWLAQVRPSDQATLAEALMPFMPILTIFNVAILLLGIYLLIASLQKKRVTH